MRRQDSSSTSAGMLDCGSTVSIASAAAAAAVTGLDHTWGVELYGELLEIGGGKERMTKYFKASRHSRSRT